MIRSSINITRLSRLSQLRINLAARSYSVFSHKPQQHHLTQSTSYTTTAKMASPEPKRTKTTSSPYTLIYWPGIPGRGEPIRLVLEEAAATYTDTAQSSEPIPTRVAAVRDLLDPDYTGDKNGNPPPMYPPILRHGDLEIFQSANILQYIAEQEGLGGDEGKGKWIVNGLAQSALDAFLLEVHDCHHPIANGLYYEDQKDEALRTSKDYVTVRLPKFLGYFERVLKGQEGKGEGENWLYGGRLTYADLVLFQGLDGTMFQFPKAMTKAKESGEYDRVFKLYEAVNTRPRIKAYLESDKRQKYSNGIWRYYEELDVLE